MSTSYANAIKNDFIHLTFFKVKIILQIPMDQLTKILTKAIAKKEGQKIFVAVPKMMSFSQLPAVKKTPFLVQLEHFFAILIL